MEGLDCLVALEELYISHNGIEEIGGLDKNVKCCVCVYGVMCAMCVVCVWCYVCYVCGVCVCAVCVLLCVWCYVSVVLYSVFGHRCNNLPPPHSQPSGQLADPGFGKQSYQEAGQSLTLGQVGGVLG